MRHLRKFSNETEMNTVLANSTVGVIGLAYEGGNAVIKSVTPPAPVIEYTVTTHVIPRRSGTVTGVESSYASGALVELTANANSNYQFNHWEDENGIPFGDDPTNPVLRFNITQDADIFAVFDVHETKWNLSCVIVPSSAESVCSVSGTGRVSQGSNPVLRASYTNPYYLDHWEIDGENKGNADSLEVRLIQSDVTAYVYFGYIPQDRTITVTSNNQSYGTVQIEDYEHQTSNASLVIPERTQAILTATPNSGYQFEGWYYNNEKVSSDAVYTFTLPEWSTDRTYTANFINAQA